MRHQRRTIATVIVVAAMWAGISSKVEAAVLTFTNGLILLLDGAHVVMGSGGVDTWSNQASGAGVSADFVQAASNRQPALAPNAIGGQPALDFDGADDFFNNPGDAAWEWDYDSNPTNAARWTVFFVCKADSAVGSRFLMRSGYNDYIEGAPVAGHDHLWGVRHDDTNCSAHSRDSGGVYQEASSVGAVNTNWHIVAGLYNIGTVNPSIVLYVDNAAVASNTPDITRQMGGHRRTNIGADSADDAAPAEYFDGQIAEILIYKEALTAWQIAEVNGYLADKYGFANNVPSGLVLHCVMDDRNVARGGARPPPPLSTDDGNWTVEDRTIPAEDGTAIATNTGGQVISSETGVIGQAIRFSDSKSGDRRVDFGLVGALEPGTGSLSVALWFNQTTIATNSGVQFIASHGNASSANDGWGIFMENNYLKVRCNSGGVNSNNNKAQVTRFDPANNVWYHLVMVMDRNGDRLRAYLNGSAEGFSPDPIWGDAFTTNAITSAGKELQLGARNDEQGEWSGLTDDFAIWRRTLSANEVSAIYAMGKDGRTFFTITIEGTLLIVQ